MSTEKSTGKVLTFVNKRVNMTLIRIAREQYFRAKLLWRLRIEEGQDA